MRGSAHCGLCLSSRRAFVFSMKQAGLEGYASRDQNQHEQRVQWCRETNGLYNDICSGEGGQDDQRPVKESADHGGTHDAAENEYQPGKPLYLPAQRVGKAESEVATGQKTGYADGQLLYKEGQQSAQESSAQGNDENEPDGLFLEN